MTDKNTINKHDLISETAHALRGLVGTILNNAGFIVRGIEPEHTLEDAKEIYETTRKLSPLIDSVIEILECGRKDYDWMAVDITQLIEEVCFRMQENQRQPSKAIRSMASSLLPRVWADGETLCRVIELLLLNQIKASSQNTVYINTRLEDAHVIVTMGSTATPATQPVALPNSHIKGELGLELLLCLSLLELHRGSLWATAESLDSVSGIHLNFSVPIAQQYGDSREVNGK